jgi:hypothetical protein
MESALESYVRKWSVAGWMTRAALLVILSTSGLLVFTYTNPREATPGQLVDDLRQGRVEHLERPRGEGYFVDGERWVRWSTGLLTWYETSVPGPGWPSTAPGRWGEGSDGDAAILEGVVGQAPNRVRLLPLALHEKRYPWEYHPAQLAPFALALWIPVFLVMLCRFDHRYANRWAWTWLFTIGVVGVLPYLLLEARPLWARDYGAYPPTRRYDEDEKRWSGTKGFIAALPLGMATALAAFGLRSLP